MNEIDNEKQIQHQLSEEIQEWEKKVQLQRKKMGGAEATRSFAQHTQKRMSVLEGRLHRVRYVDSTIMILIYLVLHGCFIHVYI